MHVRLLLPYSCQGTHCFARAGPAHAFAKLFAEIALLVASLRLRQREEIYVLVLIFVQLRLCVNKRRKKEWVNALSMACDSKCMEMASLFYECERRREGVNCLNHYPLCMPARIAR